MTTTSSRTATAFHDPWHAVYEKGPGPGWSVVNALGDTVCRGKHSMFDDRDFPLIAAAPEMLAALQWLLGNKWTTDKDNMEFTGTISCYQMDKIREAVAKANGAAS